MESQLIGTKERKATIMRKSKNALTHGVYASDIVLPWESLEHFKALWTGLRDELRPDGTSEERIVFDVTLLYLKKARVNRHVQLSVCQDPLASQIIDSGKRSTKGISTHLDAQRMTGSDYLKAKSKLPKLMSSLAARPNMSDKQRKRTLREMEELQGIIADGPPESYREVDPRPILNELAKGIELEARLDGMIDKAIQRLMVVKEFKRLNATILIPSKPAEDNDNSDDNEDSGATRRAISSQRP